MNLFHGIGCIHEFLAVSDFRQMRNPRSLGGDCAGFRSVSQPPGGVRNVVMEFRHGGRGVSRRRKCPPRERRAKRRRQRPRTRHHEVGSTKRTTVMELITVSAAVAPNRRTVHDIPSSIKMSFGIGTV